MASNVRNVAKNPGKNQEISTKGTIYRVAGVEVNPSQASMRRGAEPVVLRPKTYRLLLYLLEHHNRLVTKEELIDEVWEGTAVSDGVLVHSVVELRRAFGEDPKEPQIIRTFPKQGYGLMAPVEAVAAAEGIIPPAGEPGPARPALRTSLPAGIAAGLILLALGILLLHWKGKATVPRFREAAWWKLDDARGTKASDASGNGMTGSITGGARWVAGKQHTALWFDGFESAVTGPADFLPSGSAPRTITAWFQAAGPHLDYTSLFEYGSNFRGGTAGRFRLILHPDGRLDAGSALLGGLAVGGGQWNDDGWHFVAATYEGPSSNRVRIYADGGLDGEAKLTVTPETSGGVWKIGNWVIGGTGFRGVIDDVRVYPLALGSATLAALYRCSTGIPDVGPYYYLPVHSGDVAFDSRPEGSSTPFRNAGKDFAGIQLARSDGDCGLANLEGADAGQDLRIAVDLLAPSDAEGRATRAGPYFRSRLAAGGDGLIGGTSAGYWVQLLSSGMVKVDRLNPQAVVAFSTPIPGFDCTIFHHLEMEARGENLVVWLDGRQVWFDQGGQRVERVAIRAAWDGPPRIGFNQGAAGVAFGAAAYEDRGRVGGQRAKNLQVSGVGQ